MNNYFNASLDKQKNDVILVTRNRAAEMLNISLPVLDILLKRKENPLPSFLIGKKILIPTWAIQKWVDDEVERQAKQKQEMQSKQAEYSISPDVKTWEPLTEDEMRICKNE
jgi:hypothetical protein